MMWLGELRTFYAPQRQVIFTGNSSQEVNKNRLTLNIAGFIDV